MTQIDYGEGELLMRRSLVSQKILPSVEARLNAYADGIRRQKEELEAGGDDIVTVLRAQAHSNAVLAAVAIRVAFAGLSADNAVLVFEAVDYAVAGTRGLYRVGLIDERALRGVARIATCGAATAVKCGRVTDGIAEAYEEYDMSIGPDTDPAFTAKGTDIYRWGHTLVREHLKSKLSVIRGGLH